MKLNFGTKLSYGIGAICDNALYMLAGTYLLLFLTTVAVSYTHLHLTHPHTSAGRVPSDAAYRLYVNALMEKKELSNEEKNIIAQRLSSNRCV